MQFDDGYGSHDTGDEQCQQCWKGYPEPHGCGGLLHADIDDDPGVTYMLIEQCDGCGDQV